MELKKRGLEIANPEINWVGEDKITSNTIFNLLFMNKFCSGPWEAEEVNTEVSFANSLIFPHQCATLLVILPKEQENQGPAALHSCTYVHKGHGNACAHFENKHWKANKSLTRLSS